MMTKILDLATFMQTVLNDLPNQLARSSGFIQRQRNLSGATFVQAVVLGWLSTPDSSLSELSQSAANVGATISRQGLAQRFTPAASDLLLAVLVGALQLILPLPPADLPVLKRFAGVYVLDSTLLKLPASVRHLWPGGGGQPAALKISVCWELLSGCLWRVHLHAGVEHDQSAPLQSARLPVGALRITDLGYFNLATLAQLAGQGVFWLTRYKSGTVLYTRAGQRLHLLDVLAAQTDHQAAWDLHLGRQQRIACRLIVQRVPDEVVHQRRQRLQAEAQRRGRPVSVESWQLAAWTLYVTNVPAERLSSAQALVLGAYRWQIELLFKLWKDEGQLNVCNSQKPERVLCEAYGKLLALLLQHYLLVVGCWQFVDRSLVQASRTIRKTAWHLASVLLDTPALCQALDRLMRSLARCRVGTSRSRPRAHQRLAHVHLLT